MKNRVIATISIISFILTLIALGLSITALCQRYPRYNMEFDYLGLLIGLAALLVTLTVGWQIYTIIDVRSTIQKQNEKIQNSLEFCNDLDSKIDICLNISRIETASCICQGFSISEEEKQTIIFGLMAFGAYDPLFYKYDQNEKKIIHDALNISAHSLKFILKQKLDDDLRNLKDLPYDSKSIEAFKRGIAFYGDSELIEWSLKFVSGQG